MPATCRTEEFTEDGLDFRLVVTAFTPSVKGSSPLVERQLILLKGGESVSKTLLVGDDPKKEESWLPLSKGVKEISAATMACCHERANRLLNSCVTSVGTFQVESRKSRTVQFFPAKEEGAIRTIPVADIIPIYNLLVPSSSGRPAEKRESENLRVFLDFLGVKKPNL